MPVLFNQNPKITRKMYSYQKDSKDLSTLPNSPTFFHTSPCDSNTMLKCLSTDSPNQLIAAVYQIVASSNHSHPRILTYQSYHIEHFSSWKAMIKVKKLQGNLLCFLREQRNSNNYFSKGDLINHFYPLVSALDSLHPSNTTHQNIKAENLLFNKDNKVYLTDSAPVNNEIERISQENINNLEEETYEALKKIRKNHYILKI